MKFLRKFIDQAAYNTAKSGSTFYRPAVSLIGRGGGEIKYDPIPKIYYTTTDDNPYPLEQIIAALQQMGATYNGPNIISNIWDADKQMYVMVFDDEVTVLGDVDTETMTVEGPFFASNSDGLSCNVETIILPRTITRIGDYAFSGCSGLTSIEIPNSITSIGEGAFVGCSSLTSVTIPDSVRSIGDGAFWYCKGGEYIGECYYLGDVITDTLASSEHTVKDLIIREGTKYIESESIRSYQTISFPSTTKIIGSTAIFRQDGASVDLISVTCYAITPPVINHNSLGLIDDTTVFYVPVQSVNAYKVAPGWSEYADRIQAISEQ